MPLKWLTSYSSYFDTERLWGDTFRNPLSSRCFFSFWQCMVLHLKSLSQNRRRRLGAILETLCFSVHPKGPLEVTWLLEILKPDCLHSSTERRVIKKKKKKWKCSTKVKYRSKWECLGCCGGTLEEVVMMTALTQCRCSKAWQVGQLPRTHYFSPETNLVMR